MLTQYLTCLLYLETIDDFQYLILESIISMFIVVRNNMPKELIVYLLFSY